MRRDLAHISEQALIDRLILGDPAAREFLYDRYAAALYGVVLQLVPVKDRASDVMVRVFTWVYLNIKSYQTSGYKTLFAWLLRKTREMAIKEAIPEGSLIGTELIRNEEGVLQRFYVRLPTAEQQVFRLCYFRGLSTTTIARMMAISEGQVNEILEAAMKAFRKFLSDTWN
ncbi:DNA-directed RNA polymerase specialized sigma subunit, sigma24 family [Chitinophaga jiangningensis]|uniref:DNA-directed RNA polymerase specialized sigma subunit, sigma24 family n=1 Tax=Chitinophaga jiangningensis TaxID=1419482 RepID=A0A1M7HXT5_9BACT|nr:sigma-70 family RNA polymerase sigma factor [Chitinophaga jiangningensis]SHM33189.1 DNA-directed RNA polymerase specialized sigma subunit, sigma24 family [Chitinophaga jiangningensis]